MLAMLDDLHNTRSRLSHYKGVEGFITHIVVKSVLWYTVIVEGAGFGGNDP